MAGSTPSSPYAARAEQHWKTFLPGDYAKIPREKRTAFFAAIGEEIEQRIMTRTEQLTSGAPQGTGYLQNLAGAMTARREAELQVLDEMLPAPPDPEENGNPAGS